MTSGPVGDATTCEPQVDWPAWAGRLAAHVQVLTRRTFSPELVEANRAAALEDLALFNEAVRAETDVLAAVRRRFAHDAAKVQALLTGPGAGDGAA